MSRRPKLSDDELLALVCELGRGACTAVMHEALTARMRADISRAYIQERVDRLRGAGLLRCVYGVLPDEIAVRLTALGVERLRALQREPLAEPTNGGREGPDA